MGIKGWIYTIAGIAVAALVAVSQIQASRIRQLKTDLSYSRANEKALFAERDSLRDDSRTLYLTVEQLNCINDSIVQKMNEVRRSLRMKDREIQELQYQLSEASRTDTVIFRDTLFRDPEFQMDTTMGDMWYKVRLGLRYPSTIAVTPSFISERYTNMYLKKETVNPPKKCWLGRVLQRKRKVMVVEIREENPYINVKEQKYIKIIE